MHATVGYYDGFGGVFWCVGVDHVARVVTVQIVDVEERDLLAGPECSLVCSLQPTR
jgi:hypothetical protein